MRPAKEINKVLFILPLIFSFAAQGAPVGWRDSPLIAEPLRMVLTLREFNKDKISVFIFGEVGYRVVPPFFWG